MLLLVDSSHIEGGRFISALYQLPLSQGLLLRNHLPNDWVRENSVWLWLPGRSLSRLISKLCPTIRYNKKCQQCPMCMEWFRRLYCRSWWMTAWLDHNLIRSVSERPYSIHYQWLLSDQGADQKERHVICTDLLLLPCIAICMIAN